MKKANLFSRISGFLIGKMVNPFPFNRIPAIDGIANQKLTQPYKRSTWVMRAIKHVAGPIAAVPLTVNTGSRAKPTPLNDDATVEFLQAPVIGLSHHDFIEACTGWIKLSGEVFLIKGDDWLLPFPKQGNLQRLILARPNRMRHIVRDGVLEGWEYSDANGKRYNLLPEQVLQIKSWNPFDDFRGLGEYEAAELAAEGDYAAGLFIRNIFQNQGQKGEYIVAKNGAALTQDQRDQIVLQLRQKRAAASRGELVPAFLTGDISIEDPKLVLPDASFQGSRLQNRHEIYMAFGVPASMADIVASFSIGSASDRFRLIEETCMPLGRKIADTLEVLGAKFSGKPVFVDFDWDEHSVMQQVRAERIEGARKLWEMAMPMQKVNEYLRLGLPEFDGWDISYIPYNIMPAGEVRPGVSAAPPQDQPTADKPKPSEQDNETTIEQMMRALQSGHKKAEHKAAGDRPAHEIALWKNHMAQRRPVINKYASAINRVLMNARRETLAKLEKNHTAGRAVATKAAASDFMFDLSSFTDGFQQAMRKVGAASLIMAGQQLYTEIGKDDPFTMPGTEVLQALQDRANKLADVPDELYETVQSALEEGITAGDSMAMLQDRVRSVFNDFSAGRAKTVAMTETSAIYGIARDSGMRQAGVRYRKWLSSGLPTMRQAHAAANGQTVAIDEPFLVGGEHLMFPGDPKGHASNVINCHCVAVAVAAPASDNTPE